MKTFPTRRIWRALAAVATTLVLSPVFWACQKKFSEPEVNLSNARLGETDRKNGIDETEQQSMRREFGLALAKSLKESKEFRALLRTKALEMIDEDYDVLFALIRDEVLGSKLTVRELLSKHLKNKGRLEQIERAMPTLTIFVPMLPNNSFSAQTWDTENMIPLVAIKSIKSDDVPIVDAEGVEAVLPAKYAPGFPVVVVKNSIRIMDDSSPNFTKLTSKTVLASSNGKSYKFIDDSFDRKSNLKKKRGARLYFPFQLEQKIKDAYEFFPTSDAGWQRDYIYYNLTSTSTRGAFSLQFKETLVAIRMSDSDPMGAYNVISDATDDPRLQPSSSTDQHTFWTSTSYNFIVRVVYNSKNGTGAEFEYRFPVLASDLWEVGYEAVRFPGFWPWDYYYVYFPNSITSKTVDMRQELFNWNLNNYATTIIVKFEEFDTLAEITETSSTGNKYAFNFGIDPADGIFKKLGLKFGASGEVNQNNSTITKRNEGSDIIGSALLDFGDAIVIGKPNLPFIGTMYNVREYPAGYCSFVMRPVQVQP